MCFRKTTCQLYRNILEFLAMGITVNAHIDAEENGDGTHWEVAP